MNLIIYFLNGVNESTNIIKMVNTNRNTMVNNEAMVYTFNESEEYQHLLYKQNWDKLIKNKYIPFI